MLKKFLFIISFSVACIPRPDVDSSKLGVDCDQHTDCPEGNTCKTYSHPSCVNQSCQTCEISCESDFDCPEGFSCNLPPLQPGTVPNICESDAIGEVNAR